jgi:2-phosphosulfolactate phosphatase
MVWDGASPVLLASSPTDALAIKSQLGPTAIAVTDGELSAGFDVGNSPAQAKRLTLTGRAVVQTTANGTIGVHAARHAPLVLCASLVVATATARVLLASGAERVTYVITGEQGLADEDIACADLIHAVVDGRRPPVDTINRVERSRAAAGLRRGTAAGLAGVDEDDIHLACQIDRFDFALAAIDRNGNFEIQRTNCPQP